MLFKVTHIDEAGHRHLSRVTARNSADAIDQAYRAWGDAQRLACVRMQAHPVLHVPAPRAAERRLACTS